MTLARAQSGADEAAGATAENREAAEVYLSALRSQAVRVLSLLDREPFSPTQGCMDRTHWAWKFTDFPGARFQEGLCFLSFLYATPLDDSPYYRSEKLLHWIAGGFDYWCGIQRPGGDFDEAYPYEHSLAATAFTSFYLSEAWRFLHGALPTATDERFKAALTRAGDWLVRNDETHGFLSNHLAAAAAALYHAYLISGETRFEEGSRYFLDKILRHQSDEGWYDEYGGADPGYQTHGSFYLARYLQLSGRKDLEESLLRSFDFLAHFIHPDRSLGGEYASRNTQTYYPAAFEMMANRSGAARWIAEEMRPAVTSLSAAGLGTVDAYNLFPLLNNYVFAYLAARERKAGVPPTPPEQPERLHFPKAGLLKVRKARYDLFVGLGKGGVVKLFDRAAPRLVFSNAGYIGKLRGGGTVSNQWLEPSRHCEVADGEIAVDGCFYKVSRPVMSPLKFMVLRGFNLTLGRMQKPAAWLKSVLVKVLIYRKRQMDLHVRRRIVLHDDGIEVHDRLHGGGAGEVDTLVTDEAFTTIHMGSARYHVPAELTSTKDGGDAFYRPILADELRQGAERRCRIVLP
ncbi:hypothetical protein [Ferruginivarius sediminum]|uniref:Uncharacterized protein n=1 Tax=Ferruginivarius sediminum TaxID=2661937 RepID=A0A369TAF5_9PROT|nr:hypothetical protein [Ferruginivarius sediminum]RDD62293.1 hypothetical protein DRB17_08665 [Ferruginivarius sediminum]